MMIMCYNSRAWKGRWRWLVWLAAAVCGAAFGGGVAITKIKAFDNPKAVPGMRHPTHGYLQFALIGRKSTTLHVVAPPGWKCPPHNHPGPEYECVTVITRGSLVLVQRLPNGLIKRRTFKAGDAFLWPMGPDDYYGFENPSRFRSCEMYMVYVPALPKILTPLDGLAWIQAGAPQTGPPPGFKPRTDPYPR